MSVIRNALVEAAKKRFIGCHSKCQEYSDWVTNRENIKAIINCEKSDEVMKKEADIKGTKRRKRGFWR